MTGTLLLACCIALAWVITDSHGRVPDSSARPTPLEHDLLDQTDEDDGLGDGPVHSSLHWSGRPGRARYSRRPRRRRVTSRRPRGMRPAGPRPRTARVH